MSSDHTAAALTTLHAVGLEVDAIQWDGVLHRVPTSAKPHGKNGAYIAYGDAPASLWWCDWASGESGTWTAKTEAKLTAGEKAELSRRMEEGRAAREAEQARVHVEAAAKAQTIYEAATDCAEHPYLTAKKVRAVPGLKTARDGRLIVPVREESGKLTSLQFIDQDGTKRFLVGGRKRGCFFSVGGKVVEKPLLIAEGLATALSLYECTGYPVLVAFDAGNLQPVAEMARRKYPDRQVVVCADNDAGIEGNPGLTKATAAALAVNGLLAVPSLKAGGKCDFNDLHQREGRDAVWQQFGRAAKAQPPKDKADVLPEGYEMRTIGKRPGLWHIEPKDDGDPVETWLSGPFEILGETRSAESNAWGLYLRWIDADGKNHTWAMSRALLAGRDSSAWRCVLADGGLRIATSTKARGMLSGYFDGFRTVRRVLCVERTGWHRDGAAFVLPDETIVPATAQNEVGTVGTVGTAYGDKAFQGTDYEKRKSVLSVPDDEQIVLQAQTASNPFLMAGTLTGWQSTIGEWARGNSRLTLSLCAAFASPLLYVSGEESGGYNFVGKTSCGKTTALNVAGSVWGRGSSFGGYVQSWRATSNGLEGEAALHSDALLCLDELGQATATTVAAAAYMLGNGAGKSRMRADGTARAVKTWRVMFLSTGEVGLGAKIAEENRGRAKAGQLVRLVDIPADAGAGFGLFEELHGHESAQAFADALKFAATVHYGHAARAFLSSFLDNKHDAEATLKTRMRDGLVEICPVDADSEVRRVAKRFLLCAVAGEMAAAWGILPWEQGEAFAAVQTCFEAWLSLRGGIGAAEDTGILEQVSLFLEQHGQSRFQDIEKPDVVCINRCGFRRPDGDSTIYYVFRQSFKEVCAGFDPRRAARVLRDKGILLTDADGRNLARQVKLPGLGKQRCYVLCLAEAAGTDSVPTVPTCGKSSRYSETLMAVGGTDRTDRTDLKTVSRENFPDRVII